MLRHALESRGHQVVEARDEPEARRALQGSRPSLVLTDLRLPAGDGFGVLAAAKDLDPDLPVVVMTAYGSIQDAVAAMKQGALDFLAKPVDPDHLLMLIERALAQRRLAVENLLLKEELASKRGVPRIVGEAPALRQVFVALHRAAATDTTVLLDGESGTGKELFARALHALSARADGPFVAINCAAIPENLLETELFGYEKGAFTGAAARKPGKFELANRGTLFLDEIGELSFALQGKILRALEERTFERVGGTVPLRVDVRLVAATNKNLRAADRGSPVPGGSVLPSVGVSHHGSAAARPARRHPDPRPALHRSVLPRHEEAAACPVAGRRARALRLRLAGQRSRAAELHRARGDSHRRRHHPPPSSAPGPAPGPAAGRDVDPWGRSI